MQKNTGQGSAAAAQDCKVSHIGYGQQLEVGLRVIQAVGPWASPIARGGQFGVLLSDAIVCIEEKLRSAGTPAPPASGSIEGETSR